MKEIPQSILDADHKWNEEIKDLLLEYKCAKKCDELFYSTIMPNFYCADEVQKKLDAKMREESPLLAYLISQILNAQTINPPHHE